MKRPDRFLQVQRRQAKVTHAAHSPLERTGEMNEQVGVALRRALHGWCDQPGAFTAARNGGAESVLRNAVLGELEVELACLGFPEANGVHVDVALARSQEPFPCASNSSTAC